MHKLMFCHKDWRRNAKCEDRGGATGWSLWAADHPALRPTKAHRYSRDWRICLCAAQPSTFCLSANAHRIRLRPFFSVRLCGVPSNSSVCMRCSCRSRRRGDDEHGHRASATPRTTMENAEQQFCRYTYISILIRRLNN